MEKFKIKDKVTNFILLLHKDVVAKIPKTHTVFKNELIKETFELHKNVLRANFNIGSVKNKYLKEVLVNLATIDMILGILQKFGYIEKKKFITLIANLNELNKMVNGWINSEKKKS